MRFLIPFLISCSVFVVTNGQGDPLATFKRLHGTTWQAEGEWGNGQTFKQEATFQMVLAGNTAQVTSKGYTDKEQSEFGLRNIG